MPRKAKKKVVCPRCGEEGWLSIKKIRGRIYVYVNHYKNKKRWSCYLGPLEGYENVWRFNEGKRTSVYVEEVAV